MIDEGSKKENILDENEIYIKEIMNILNLFLNKKERSSVISKIYSLYGSFIAILVPRAGLEPARSCLRGILNPLCLPIPPPGHIF